MGPEALHIYAGCGYEAVPLYLLLRKPKDQVIEQYLTTAYYALFTVIRVKYGYLRSPPDNNMSLQAPVGQTRNPDVHGQ